MSKIFKILFFSFYQRMYFLTVIFFLSIMVIQVKAQDTDKVDLLEEYFKAATPEDLEYLTRREYISPYNSYKVQVNNLLDTCIIVTRDYYCSNDRYFSSRVNKIANSMKIIENSILNIPSGNLFKQLLIYAKYVQLSNVKEESVAFSELNYLNDDLLLGIWFFSQSREIRLISALIYYKRCIKHNESLFSRKNRVLIFEPINFETIYNYFTDSQAELRRVELLFVIEYFYVTKEIGYEFNVEEISGIGAAIK